MTTAAAQSELSSNLFLDAFAERPSAGKDAIYQRMSGGKYADVQQYTFLTIPGPIGLASLSGSGILIFVFSFVVLLIGHTLEYLTAFITRNVGAAAVTGVALAYLVVQMNVPWTLIVFVIELLLVVLSMGLVRHFIFSSGPRLPELISFLSRRQ